MEDSFYESFRWLDEETDIDLSLDHYPQKVAMSSSPSSSFQRCRASFRRTLSIRSINHSRKSTSLASYRRAPVSSPMAESHSAFTNISSRRSSISRPMTRSKIRHMSQSSISTIDPSAQYYHDPEARLKLRVCLASPKSFDEAIEFGFPAVKEDGATATVSVDTGGKLQVRGSSGSFLDGDDGDGSISHDKRLSYSTIPRASYPTEMPQVLKEPRLYEDVRQSWMSPANSNLQRSSSTREMTLRMTLTRPDLRADPCLTSDVTTPPAQLSPLLLNQDGRHGPWDSHLDDESLVKKVWRKLRKRND
ncbi:hypothetical protein BDV18DRAFT_164035 [Aspergillus unguis]